MNNNTQNAPILTPETPAPASPANPATVPGELNLPPEVWAALGQTMTGQPVKLYGFTLHPVKMRLYCILKTFGCPILAGLEILAEEMNRADGLDESTPEAVNAAFATRQRRADERMAKEVSSSPADLAGSLFAFTRPAKEIESILKAGLESYREKAVAEFADKLSVPEFENLKMVVSSLLVQSLRRPPGTASPAPAPVPVEPAPLSTAPDAPGELASHLR